MTSKFQIISGSLSKNFTLPDSKTQLQFSLQTQVIPQTFTQVVEQDRYLLMSQPEAIVESEEHPIRLHTEVIEQSKKQPGSVLYQKNRLSVVIYDIDRDPISEPQWISLAYRNLFQFCAEHSIERIAIPLLGCRYKTISEQQSFQMLLAALPNQASFHLLLRVNRSQLEQIIPLLEK